MATGTENRQRQRVISFRVDPAEYDRIKTEADRAGVTVGTFARDVLIGAQAPRRVRRPPAEKAELVRILGGHRQLVRDGSVGLACGMKIPSEMPRLKGYRFAREIVAYAVWAYHRFALSTADVEDLLAERGVIVSRETE